MKKTILIGALILSSMSAYSANENIPSFEDVNCIVYDNNSECDYSRNRLRENGHSSRTAKCYKNVHFSLKNDEIKTVRVKAQADSNTYQIADSLLSLGILARIRDNQASKRAEDKIIQRIEGFSICQ